jgi:hypothetical protein
MPATAVRAVVVPSQQEIEERFRSLYPELLSRACAIAAHERDPEEAVAEIMGFSWWNYQQAALRGRWLSPGQLAWVAMQRVRGEACSLGSPRSSTDVMAPACQRRRRANVIPLSSLSERCAEDPCRKRFGEVIGQGQRNPADEAATRIDWKALRADLPGRLRCVLDGLVAGRGTSEIAKRMRLSPARISQLKQELGAAVVGFFSSTLPDWTSGLCLSDR